MELNVPATVALLVAANVVVVIPPLCVLAPVNVEVLDVRTLPKDPVEAVMVELVAPTPPRPNVTLGPPASIVVAAPAKLMVVAVSLSRLMAEAPALNVEAVKALVMEAWYAVN